MRGQRGAQQDSRIFSKSNLTSYRVLFDFIIPALYMQHSK
jgi:hypothetical protein